MNKRFADSFYFFALLNPRDEKYEVAVKAAMAHEHTVTTDWVHAELADGFSRSADRASVAAFIRALRYDAKMTIIEADRQTFDQGLALYASRPDKHWSITDCISFVIMRRFGIDQALTGDHHFEQAGFVTLLK